MDGEQVKELIGALASLPPVKPKSFQENLDDAGLLQCRVTGRSFPASMVTIINTGYIKALDIIHPDVKKEIPPEYCRIVCVVCKEVILVVKPGTNNRGFELKPGRCYHVQDCPKCNPSKYEGKTVESRLIEEIVWSKDHKRLILNMSD